MPDRAVLAMAVAAAAGARLAAGIPLPAAAAVVLASLAARRPWLLVVGAAMLTSALGARAWDGLAPPPPGRVAAEVELVSDPVEVGAAVRVDVAVGPRRLEAWARGAEAAALRPRLAGEVVALSGDVSPLPGRLRGRLARRHVSGRLAVRAVGGWRPGSPPMLLANGFRHALARGARDLADRDRSLLLGLVLGDRRAQPPDLEADFRASGLTHLLAVSGQNVAFVLALARPLLSRTGLWARLVGTCGVLGLFALVTRWEPSVLRACAMAGIAATAATLGRPAAGARVLALAVTLLLAVDPLLVGSVGFLLSVGASAGILLLAGPVASRVPGPRWLAEPIAVTLAAQAGVAPVLLPVFGSVPLVSLPANLLAGPAAGPVMMWGLTAGAAAGVLGPRAAAVLHVPTQLLTGWIAGVAGVAARLGLPEVRAGHVASAAAAGAAAAVLVRRGSRRRAVGALVVLGAIAGAAWGPRAPQPLRDEVTSGAVLYRAAAPTGGAVGVLLVVDEPDTAGLLAALRRRDVARVDVLAVTRGRSAAAAGTVHVLRRRLQVRAVLAPAGHRIRDAVTPRPDTPFEVGGLSVRALAAGPGLRLDVRRVGSPP